MLGTFSMYSGAPNSNRICKTDQTDWGISRYFSVPPEKDGVKYQLNRRPLSSTSLPIHYSLIILMFDIITCEQIGVSFNKQQINKRNNIQTNNWSRPHERINKSKYKVFRTHVMRVYGWIEVLAPLSLDFNTRWSESHTCHFIFRARYISTHWEESWVGPRPGLDFRRRAKPLVPAEDRTTLLCLPSRHLATLPKDLSRLVFTEVYI